MDKPALISAIIEELESSLGILISAANTSKDEATNEENRQEGMYDMRAQSAAYVAEGQARLAAELAAAIAAYRNLSSAENPSEGPAAIGSVVIVDTQGRKAVYFIGPARGGIDVDLAGVTVTVITAHSPLGRQLVGRRAGDSITLPGARSGPLGVVVKIE